MSNRFWMVLVLSAASAAWAEPAASPSSGQSASQTRVSYAVQGRREGQVLHELRMLPYYSVFDNLEFQVKGDRVVLTGQVVRAALQSDAESRVRKLEWVENVENRIEVLPVSFNDDRIRRGAYRAIYSHSVLHRYALQPVPPIHIIVRNGHMTLVGVVSTEMERNVAYIQASSVSGAFSVTNRLRVERGS